MPPKTILLPGAKINFLTVLKEIDPIVRIDGKGERRLFLCRCDCGKEKEILLQSLSSGRTKSCGCNQKQVVSAGKYSKKHGLSSNPIFSVWRKMMARCYDKKHQGYKDYGGRGIIVCKSWHNPIVFVEWCLRNGYKKELQLDRINNNGIYKPSNCRFATLIVQLYNRRNTVTVKFNGQDRPLLPLLRELGKEKMYNRLREIIKSGGDISNHITNTLTPKQSTVE